MFHIAWSTHYLFFEEVSFTKNGGVEIQLPKDSRIEEKKIFFSEGDLSYRFLPVGADLHFHRDGTAHVPLKSGMRFDEGAKTLGLNNYWANKFVSDSVIVELNGDLSVQLPDGVEYYEDNSFVVPQKQVDFLREVRPQYLHDCDFAELTPEGNYHLQPTDGMYFDKENKELQVSPEAYEDLPFYHGIHFKKEWYC